MAEQFPFGLAELRKELEGQFDPGEELEDEDFEEIKTNPPKRPSFPFVVFGFAILKDFIDVCGLGIIGTVLNIFAWLVITIYLWGKVGFIKKRLYRRFVFALVLEFIPFVNMVPQWSIFVFRGYAKENKDIDQVLTAIEKLVLRSKAG